jgi:TonB family protein
MLEKRRLLGIVAFFIALGVAASPAQTELLPRRIVGLRYPRFAHLTGVQGKVVLTATISVDGKVQAIRVVTPVNPLTEAAKESLAKWLFSGCKAGSDRCEATVTFSFVLSGTPCHIDSDCSQDFEVDLPDKVEVRSQPALAIVN